jgi:hypothetical protein
MPRSNNAEEKRSTGVRRHAKGGKHSTINVNVQRSSPKFKAVGSGVLEHVNGKDRIARNDLNRWQSLPKNVKHLGENNSTPPLSPPPLDLVEMPAA